MFRNPAHDIIARGRSKLFGMLVCKERWGLSWRGRGILALVVVFAGFGLVLGIYPFLAVTHRVDAKVLVVEGWLDQYTFPLAAGEFKAGGYARAFTTGGPVVGSGGYTTDYQTEAHVGAGRLAAAGVPDDLVRMIPSHVWNRNRTYNSALALRDWFQKQNLHVDSINVLTEGAHARRTRLLFQEALGPGVKVGVISVSNPDYDPEYWWRYSDGVREVSSEALAYVYAKFFFWPASK
jgi:uncharacterized SAM-binding protein YcdF (DUF218 family)